VEATDTLSDRTRRRKHKGISRLYTFCVLPIKSPWQLLFIRSAYSKATARRGHVSFATSGAGTYMHRIP
jgi:hypothetical protein